VAFLSPDRAVSGRQSYQIATIRYPIWGGLRVLKPPHRRGDRDQRDCPTADCTPHKAGTSAPRRPDRRHREPRRSRPGFSPRRNQDQPPPAEGDCWPRRWPSSIVASSTGADCRVRVALPDVGERGVGRQPYASGKTRLKPVRDPAEASTRADAVNSRHRIATRLSDGPISGSWNA
jgi:hypothetical protein